MSEKEELTEREREILALVATGASNKEIAQRLYLSTNTVKVHLRNIFVKTGVQSRTEATLYAMQSGLVPAVGSQGTPANGVQTAVLLGETATSPGGSSGAPPMASGLGHRRMLIALVVLLALGAAATALLTLGRNPSPGAQAALSPVPTPVRWQRAAGLPEPRSGFAAAFLDSTLYVAGGQSPSGITDSFWSLAAGARSWQTLDNLPEKAADIGAVVIGGRIYVPGGLRQDGSVSFALWVYDPVAGTWSQRAPLPGARSAYALASFEGKMYLFGGWDGNRVTDSVYRYDPASDAWEVLTPLPKARSYSAAAVSGERIYLLGGYDGSSPLDSADAYLPSREGTGTSPWEALSPLPQGRYAAGAASLAGAIYLLGGEGAAQPLRYIPEEQRWEVLEAPPEPLGSHLAVLGSGNYLYVIGGRLGSASGQNGDAGPVPLSRTLRYQAVYTTLLPIISK